MSDDSAFINFVDLVPSGTTSTTTGSTSSYPLYNFTEYSYTESTTSAAAATSSHYLLTPSNSATSTHEFVSYEPMSFNSTGYTTIQYSKPYICLEPTTSQSFNYTTDFVVGQSTLVLPPPPPVVTTCQVKLKGNKICSVCGDTSSGFHYGAETCEACKLFFRRTISKNVKFTGLKGKNCDCRIEANTRSECSKCRFKKCIAVGMSKNKSVFGRQSKSVESKIPFESNPVEPLISLVNTIKQECTRSINFAQLNSLLVDFYIKCVEHLQPLSSSQSDRDKLARLTTESRQTLPTSLITLFCVLFDIPIATTEANASFEALLADLRQCVDSVRRAVSHHLSDLFKIGIYFKSVRILVETTPSKNDPCESRIADLMRSELTVDQTDNQQSSSLSHLFLNMNNLIYKHMTRSELERFVFIESFS